MLHPTSSSLEHCPHPTLPCSTEHPPLAVLSVLTRGTHATAPGRLLALHTALHTALMLPGLGILQIRLWAYFICSHPKKSTTSLTSKLRRPVPQKVLPWPLYSSSRQHSRSGQGCRGRAGAGFISSWGGDTQCFSLGLV